NSVLDSSYSYDSIGNILNKTDCTDARPCVSTSYTCDDVGNRLNQDGVEGAWSYNENNELLTFADTEYRYDANGNATQLLRSLSGVAGSGAVMFTSHDNYDPFGRRLWKEVGGVRTYFIYSDEGLIAEYDVSGTELRSYSYTANGLFLDFYNLPESHEINRVSRFKNQIFTRA
ncbi:MAG: hypothetical protein GY794_14350, partial [bacterium]|nr:hypothetical protein [bacterium]